MSEFIFRADARTNEPGRQSIPIGVGCVRIFQHFGAPVDADTGESQLHPVSDPLLLRELTTAVLGDDALAVTELKPKSGLYAYDAKYTDGLTEHVCPADVPDEIAEACRRIALDAHRAPGCRGTSRADFRWDDERGLDGLYLLEVNTQPGMTPLSLVPEHAAKLGIDYATLVETIVEEALGRAATPGKTGQGHG